MEPGAYGPYRIEQDIKNKMGLEEYKNVNERIELLHKEKVVKKQMKQRLMQLDEVEDTEE